MNKYKYNYYKEKITNIDSNERVIDVIHKISNSVDQIYLGWTKFTYDDLSILIDIYKFKYKNDYYIEANTDNYCEELFIMKNNNEYILTKCVEYIIDNCWYKLDIKFKSLERLCDYLDHQYLKD